MTRTQKIRITEIPTVQTMRRPDLIFSTGVLIMALMAIFLMIIIIIIKVGTISLFVWSEIQMTVCSIPIKCAVGVVAARYYHIAPIRTARRITSPSVLAIDKLALALNSVQQIARGKQRVVKG